MKNSKARMDGLCDYRLWTTAELTKSLIRKELKRRFNATLRLLDDEQTDENPMGTFRYLLNDYNSAF